MRFCAGADEWREESYDGGRAVITTPLISLQIPAEKLSTRMDRDPMGSIEPRLLYLLLFQVSSKHLGVK